jgi:hypothetical protein
MVTFVDVARHSVKRLALVVLLVFAAPAAAHPPVQWTRPLHVGSSGVDVRVAQRALARAHDRTGKATGYFGAGTKANVKRFQRRKHIPPTGILGPRTEKRLSPYVDAYGWVQIHTLWKREQHRALLQSRVNGIVVHSRFALVHEPQIHYTQGSPRTYIPLYPHFPPDTDCSGFATWELRSVGVNPGGHSFVGWTGTLGIEGRRWSVAQGLRAGDLLFYGGGYPYTHVTIYYALGFAISHGGEGGPNLVRYNYSTVSAVRRYFPPY